MDFTINDIITDFAKTFGTNYALVEVKPRPIYKDGERTDEVVYVYYIVCIDRKMKRISVKIPGKQLINSPEDGSIIRVSLENAIAKPYIMNNQLGFTITASNIKEIKE